MADGKIWLITGASRGFGRAIAQAALAKGDRVVLAARNPNDVADLVRANPNRAAPLALDLSRAETIRAAADAAAQCFGPLDVLLNNAGYVQVGAIEEVDPAQYRAIFETNFFGALELMRAVIPAMRARRAGTIMTMSAMGAIVADAGLGYYCATKAALESVSEAAAAELAPLGIRIVIIQPGSFRTEVLESRAVAPQPIGDYADTVGRLSQRFATSGGTQVGDPAKAAAIIVETAHAADPPPRLPLGQDAATRTVRRISELSAGLVKTGAQAASTAFS